MSSLLAQSGHELRRVERCQLSEVPASSAALPDLRHHRVHIGEVPNLGELSVFDTIKSELRNSHPTTGRLDSLEGPTVGTGNREVHRDIVAVDNDVSYFPIPVRKSGDQRCELRRNGGWIHRDVVDASSWGDQVGAMT